MKVENLNIVERKITLSDIFANQHPIINGWITLSAIAIMALYAITFTAI